MADPPLLLEWLPLFEVELPASRLELLRPIRLAVEILTGLDPDRADMRGWVAYWSVLTAARHMLADYEGELRDALRGEAYYPDSRTPVAAEARALAGLGRTVEVMEVAQVKDICPFCGTELLPESTFCGMCGNNL